MTSPERIYLDLCCYKRPFDDQGRERIRREAEAVSAILTSAGEGRLRLIRSPAHALENDRNPREDRRLAAGLWIDGAAETVAVGPEVAVRARELAALGFGVLDALHVAFAEAGQARWLVTCDDGLLALGHRHRGAIRVEVVDPTALPLGEGAEG